MHLEHLLPDSLDGIADPLAHLWVSVLAHRLVIPAGTEERCGGVDAALVDDGVHGDGQEGAEGRYQRYVGLDQS